jgi:hypothetical protein
MGMCGGDADKWGCIYYVNLSSYFGVSQHMEMHVGMQYVVQVSHPICRHLPHTSQYAGVPEGHGVHSRTIGGTLVYSAGSFANNKWVYPKVSENIFHVWDVSPFMGRLPINAKTSDA